MHDQLIAINLKISKAVAKKHETEEYKRAQDAKNSSIDYREKLSASRKTTGLPRGVSPIVHTDGYVRGYEARLSVKGVTRTKSFIGTSNLAQENLDMALRWLDEQQYEHLGLDIPDRIPSGIMGVNGRYQMVIDHFDNQVTSDIYKTIDECLKWREKVRDEIIKKVRSSLSEKRGQNVAKAIRKTDLPMYMIEAKEKGVVVGYRANIVRNGVKKSKTCVDSKKTMEEKRAIVENWINEILRNNVEDVPETGEG